MQKVLFSHDLIPIMLKGESLFNRADITVLTAATTDEILKIHIEETVNLIVLQHDLPGTSCEVIFDIIWQSQHLKKVVVIMICEDNAAQQARCKRCGAYAVITRPVDPALLQEQVREFLNISRRQAYRVILTVSVDGKFNNQSFLCFTENISATGALIRAERDLAPGNRIACSFYLPDGTKVKTQGEVMRVLKHEDSGEFLYGIRYTEISAENSEKIEAYVKKDRM